MGTKWLETRVLAFPDATIDDSLAFWPLGTLKTQVWDASKDTNERQLKRSLFQNTREKWWTFWPPARKLPFYM